MQDATCRTAGLPAIEVCNLSKVYRLYDRPLDRLKEALDPLRRTYHRDFPALVGVDLRVQRGETVGIVGRNGSGKSTLLKIITRVAAPSGGSVTINGRVSALLELGTGFNPELTGIENIYYNGTLLGYRREQIEAKLPQIEQFADIGDFVRQPIKSYSSGMLGRLGFAVAAAFDPDILIIDESLSVGDEAFQRKCFARIKAVQEAGAAILFVSHAANLVVELCDRAVLMDGGEKLMEGPPKAVIAQYHKLIFAAPARAAALRDEIRQKACVHESEGDRHICRPEAGRQMSQSPPPATSAPADDDAGEGAYFDENLRSQSLVEWPRRGAQILDPHVETLGGRRVNVLQPNCDYAFTYDVEFSAARFHVIFGMMLKTTVGYPLGGACTRSDDAQLDDVPAGARVKVRFRFRALLAPGAYFLNAGVMGAENGAETYLHRLIDACMVRVQHGARDAATGTVDFLVDHEVRLDSGGASPQAARAA